MKRLGTLKRFENLREIWPNEASDFTRWLAQEENFEELCKVIEMDLSVEERESTVGDFRLDLYAIEEATGNRVIIENQLEASNHDHLGKIITYASGKDASTVIWIVKKARDEHRQAIEWLNQHTDKDTGFFLIEIELWQIDNSDPAVRFNIIEKPNEWTKTVKSSSELSDTQKFRIKFWSAFNEQLFSTNTEFSRTFSKTKVRPKNFKNLSIGISNLNIELTVSPQKSQIEAALYFENNKEDFCKLEEQKDEVTQILGEMPEFREATKDCKVIIHKDVKIWSENEWPQYFNWYEKKSLKLKEVADKLLK